MSTALATSIEQLGVSLENGAEYLDLDTVMAAKGLLHRLSERVSFGPDNTIVALAGSTGSGKSSLMNAIAGMEIAKAGVRRPTTKQPVSCQWGEHTPELLDWLDVPLQYRTNRTTDLDRHTYQGYDGLVLLDLPDHDSRETDHRILVDDMITKVDLMVWVVDPQKYADDVLHREYLVPLKDHQDVLLVVLNQIDRLAPTDVDRVLDDLQNQLRQEGLDRVRVMATSTTSGAGIDALRAVLRQVVSTRNATWERWQADLMTTARQLRTGVADREASLVNAQPLSDLVESLKVTAGVPTICEASKNHYLHQTVKHLGLPYVRWWSALRRDPLQQLGLKELTGEQYTTAVSSVPEPSQVSSANVARFSRALIAQAGAGLPAPWQSALTNTEALSEAELRDTLDQTVLQVPVTPARAWWWPVANGVQWLFAISLVLGIATAIFATFLGWFQLAVFNDPLVGPLPLPAVLALGGFFGGLLTYTIGMGFARYRARKHAEQINQQLSDAIFDVAHIKIASPMNKILDRHRKTRVALDRILTS